MTRRKKITTLDNDLTRVEGFDVGKYPRHHFRHIKDPTTGIGWPLLIKSVGDDEWVAGCSRERYKSHILALELVLEGSFRFVQDGNEHIISPNQLFIVRPGADSRMSLHRVRYGKKKVMEIVGPSLPQLMGVTGLHKQDAMEPNDIEWLIAAYDRAYDSIGQPSSDSVQTCSVIAYEVMIALGRACAQRRIPADLQRAVEMMESQLSGQLTISDLCASSGLSQSAVHRLFTEHFDESPINYFINMKIQIAQSLLAGSSHSIDEVSRQLGYSSQWYFSTQFRKRIGMSPREYRKQAQSSEARPTTIARLT